VSGTRPPEATRPGPDAPRRAGALPPPGKLVSWLITAVLLGWLVVYNVLRFGGDDPADAAGPSLMIGAAAGVAVLAVWIVVRRRLVESGRLHPDRAPDEIPAPEQMDDAQRRTLTLMWPLIGLLALASMAVGVLMALDWWDTPADERSLAKVIMAVWFVASGAWLVYEAQAVRRMDAEGIDSVALAAVLTAVLAGVSLSRDIVPSGQVVLIILGGVVGAGCYTAVWRLTGSRGLPLGAAGALVAAALAIILPLAA
jgi:hypothetical protein